MPTERMEEVEVVCPHCTTPGTMAYERKWGCLACGRLIGGVWQDNPQFLTAPVKPGSLTAARLRLADAAEGLDKAAKATTWCHTVFGTEEECAAWYAKVGYTEADALAVEEECYAARTEYDLALAALRTARGEG